ncbi:MULTISPECIES: HU family DNA-binding protein [Chryseobacterium]|uniref:HU domain-containing protein n=1 Tax=Chryseobacterium salivictor TaxID=2547600 RepID=A0A4P6ZJS4_9FLAO|nr:MULTISPECIES: HU family DNA-binding protein [Chryseobacterium]MDQ0476432.1 putative histone-like DNA-binding protein [Chryseobacterium sp. MDT2-18]QBO59665.1 hypothetical protein NBC122_02865 [Chryseobacterium salivictor]
MINFKAVERRNPLLPDDPKKFYPQVKSTGVVDIRMISEELSDASTLNSVDIRAVLFGLEKSLLKYLREGYIVKFGDLGTFRPSLRGTGAETADELTASSVKKIRIIFSPSPILKHTVATAVVKKIQAS